MVYDGSPPLVQQWNGCLPSLKSIHGYTTRRSDLDFCDGVVNSSSWKTAMNDNNPGNANAMMLQYQTSLFGIEC